MTKEQIYQEIENEWKFWNDKEIRNYYQEITGADSEEITQLSIVDIRIYILEHILYQMLQDRDITKEMAQEISQEIIVEIARKEKMKARE